MISMQFDQEWTRQLKASLAPAVDLLYPPRCPLCGEGIAEQRGLCPDCWPLLDIPGEPQCSSCQRPLPENLGEMETDASGLLCAPCMQQAPVHDGIAAATAYTEASRKLILAFKHGGRIALAKMMAGLIAARLPVDAADAVLIPVPLHRFRIWRRGYNQAALLAQELARLERGELLVDGLKRIKATPSLGGLGRKERAKTLKGAIVVAKRRKAVIEGRHVILVDDVLTSGATSDACANVLKRAGAQSVTVACFARVLD